MQPATAPEFMTPADFRRIRLEAGLTLAGLADRLRVGDLRTIRRYEKGERAISGPVSLLMEMLDQGRLPIAPEICRKEGNAQ